MVAIGGNLWKGELLEVTGGNLGSSGNWWQLVATGGNKCGNLSKVWKLVASVPNLRQGWQRVTKPVAGVATGGNLWKGLVGGNWWQPTVELATACNWWQLLEKQTCDVGGNWRLLLEIGGNWCQLLETCGNWWQLLVICDTTCGRVDNWWNF